MQDRSNIVLIGMPGSGKSTLGRRLAKVRGLSYLDSDILIEKLENMSIQDIANRKGIHYLRQREGQILSAIDVQNCVIATGGSAIYSDSAIQHLGVDGVIVYLQISLPTLTKRVTNLNSRGLVKMKSHPLPRLYKERVDMYHDAADLIIPNDKPISGLGIDSLNQQINEFFDV